MLSYDRLSRKPLLFKSFTGLTVKEFDDIYDKETAKRHGRHKMGCLSKEKDRERSICTGRHFKLDAKDRFLMLLSYYRHYITCTSAGFLFDRTRVTSAGIQKIEPLVRKCVPIPKKMHKLTKRLRTQERLKSAFPGILSFTDCTEQQIPRPENKTRRKAYYSDKKKIHAVKTQIMVNNHVLIIHKTGHKKGKRHDYDIYKKNHPVTPKQVVIVFDPGCIGVGKDFPEQTSSMPKKKKRNQKDLPN